jgi:shikimate dehydrogenase
VLGSPIAHSKSPALHRAAYSVLGLDWTYEAIEVTGERLPAFLDSLDGSWRGLSLTMPLKRDVLPLLDEQDELSELTGGANTVVLEDGRVRGFNTDVFGITEALRSSGVHHVAAVHILGGGATAASAIAAVAQLGARRILVSVRTPARAERLAVLGSRLGVDVDIRTPENTDFPVPDLVVSTLPGGVDAGVPFDDTTRSSTALLDVAYDPWPSALAREWTAAGGRVVPGIDMLVHQAVAQVRAFVGGSPGIALPDETAVLAAMKHSVGIA